jgi:hypothetical protein
MTLVVSPPVLLYMGKDKFESKCAFSLNLTKIDEDLIANGLPHDVWVCITQGLKLMDSSMWTISRPPMYISVFPRE